MKSKVSVIIPTYGGEDSVIRSVKSVLSQNYKNFEVIILIQKSERKQKGI